MVLYALLELWCRNHDGRLFLCYSDCGGKSEPSVWEAVRIFWRFYWPALLCNTFQQAFLFRFLIPPPVSPLMVIVVSCLFLAAFLAMFVGRIFSRPFRGFRLNLIEPQTGAPAEFTFERRILLTRFVWRRLLLVTIIVGFLLVPLSIFVSLFGAGAPTGLVNYLAVAASAVLIVRMMFGETFGGARVELDRSREPKSAETATDPS